MQIASPPGSYTGPPALGSTLPDNATSNHQNYWQHAHFLSDHPCCQGKVPLDHPCYQRYIFVGQAILGHGNHPWCQGRVLVCRRHHLRQRIGRSRGRLGHRVEQQRQQRQHMSHHRNFDRVSGTATQGNVDLTFFCQRKKKRGCVCVCVWEWGGVRW